MAERKGGVTHTTILWVAGTLTTIVFLTTVLWPWMLGMWYGYCWSDVRSDVRELGAEIKGGVRFPQSAIEDRLLFEECVAGVVFINGRDDPAFSEYIRDQCEDYDGYKSYIIAIPSEILREIKKEDRGTFQKVTDFFSLMKQWDNVKAFMKEKTGKVPKPYCYEMEHAFSPSSDKSIPKGFYDNLGKMNTGQMLYCVEVFYQETNTDDFNYLLDVVNCPVKLEE